MRIQHVAAVCALTVTVSAAIVLPRVCAQSAQPAPWGRLHFLLGTWVGGGSGRPGDSIEGTVTSSMDLDEHVMVRKNRAEIAPKPGDKGPMFHEDMMVIYQEPGQTSPRAIYFDSEGHVIHYNVSFAAKQPGVVFESEPSDKAPRFRLVQTLESPGIMSTDFLIAPPGGEFRSYVKGVVHKQP